MNDRAAPPADYTVLVPARDEAESVDAVLGELAAVLDAVERDEGLRGRALVIDDGSADRTFERAGAWAARDPRLAAIRLERGRGKGAALQAGLARAEGRWILTLDADGQDDPADIRLLLGRLADGCDAVCGWRRERRDGRFKRFASFVYNRVLARAAGWSLHDMNGGLRGFRRELLDACPFDGGRYRLVPLMAAAAGRRVEEVPVFHRPRLHGRSRYGPGRFVKGFLDLVLAMVRIGIFRRRASRPGTGAVGNRGLDFGAWRRQP